MLVHDARSTPKSEAPLRRVASASAVSHPRYAGITSLDAEEEVEHADAHNSLLLHRGTAPLIGKEGVLASAATTESSLPRRCRSCWSCWRARVGPLDVLAWCGCAVCLYIAFVALWREIVSVSPCEAALVARTSFGAHSAEFLQPKLIHRQWKTAHNVPDDNSQGFYFSKWQEVFPEPEYKHLLWTDTSARDLIREHFSWFLEIYDGYKHNIQRADAVRYFILLHYGGLYADLDYEPLSADLWNQLPPDRLALVESPYKYNERTQNSLMSSPAACPLLQRAVSMLAAVHLEPVLKSTGPMFLSSVLDEAARRAYPVHVLPCENFTRGRYLTMPLDHTKQHLLGQLSRWFTFLFYPMKNCGDFNAPDACHFARHHCAATYMPAIGTFGAGVNNKGAGGRRLAFHGRGPRTTCCPSCSTSSSSRTRARCSQT